MSSRTTSSSTQWEYLDLLNECIKILLTIFLGIASGHFKLFECQTFVPTAVGFVMKIALPLFILRGIGIMVDFYNPAFQWTYIIAFLALRVIALIVSFVWVLLQAMKDETKGGIGMVTVRWLTLTWISTVILGVPISTSVFGSEAKGVSFGLLAGVSSFIFQLPLQLLFLECHVLEQEYFNRQREEDAHESQDVEEQQPDGDTHASDCNSTKDGGAQESIEVSESAQAETVLHKKESRRRSIPLCLWLTFVRRPDIWRKIARRVATNPVVLGIVGGFILSLSTVGPTYLNPQSAQFVHGLGWIFSTLTWNGAIVSPLSLFAMGVWMQDQGKRLFLIPWYDAAISMLSKLVLVPLIMLGLAKAFRLSDDAGRAAVLIASLPISLASFSFGSYYKIGEAILSENVALGTALMLPTVIAWNVVLDKLSIFPLHS